MLVIPSFKSIETLVYEVSMEKKLQVIFLTYPTHLTSVRLLGHITRRLLGTTEKLIVQGVIGKDPEVENTQEMENGNIKKW